MSSPPEAGVSVVIPCYNAAGTIARTLKSLTGQRASGPWEIVVADNGSTDETAEAAGQFAASLPWLRVVDASAKRGASAARNIGARAAQYRMLAFLDADDEAEPGWLSAIEQAAQGHQFFATVTVPGGGNPSLDHAGRPEQRSRLSSLLADPGFLDAAPGNCIVVSRTVFDAIGGFDEDMLAAEDTAFCWRAQLLGHPLRRVDGAVVKVYARGSNRALARQQFAWGYGAAQLRHRFRDAGMPAPNRLGGTLRWLAIVVSSPIAVFSSQWRRRWTGVASRRLGKLAGGILDRHTRRRGDATLSGPTPPAAKRTR